MDASRRGFLQGTGLIAAVAALGRARPAWAQEGPVGEWGPLVQDPEGILDLPEGFTYQVLQSVGEPMDDGFDVPGRADGMACFEDADGNWVLMRNHELSDSDLDEGPAQRGQPWPTKTWDPNSVGGVTRLVLDPETLAVLGSNLVLTGCQRNCAGGVSPWGWLSCEESTSQGHGYVFVCPIDATEVQEPQVVRAYGRFNHEAVCVDPDTLIAYLTEDRGDSAFYRFVPDDPADPHGAGQLQAMKIVGQEVVRFGSEGSVGQTWDVEWVDIDEPDPDFDTVRYEAQSKGACVFRRGEGTWWHEGIVWIVSTSGGATETGRVFRYDTSTETLELVVESTSRLDLDMPDNLCVAPWGQVFMVEDGGLLSHVRAITKDGEVVPFAKNALSFSEMCGVCFSPDGTTMFLNIQVDGLTLAIRGPFPEWSQTPTGPDDEDDGKKGCNTSGASLGWTALTLAALALRGGGDSD